MDRQADHQTIDGIAAAPGIVRVFMLAIAAIAIFGLFR